MNYWLENRKHRTSCAYEWDFETESLGDTIGEKREALFVKCYNIYNKFGCTELRMNPWIAEIFDCGCMSFYPERDDYPHGKDGPRLLRFTQMNMWVYKYMQSNLIQFKSAMGHWVSLKIKGFDQA